MTCDVLIVGGGTGGTAAALALGRSGLRVILTEGTTWIGGQLTSQLVPPDEHPWIESFGCTARYRRFRERIRQLSRPDWDGLAPFNPGGGWVSRLCHDPRIGLAVLHEAWPPELGLLLRTIPLACESDGRRIRAVLVRNLETGMESWIEARFVLDATELGDLLPMARIPFVVGAESRDETGEPHAVDAPAQPDNVQGFTWCAAVGYDPDGDHTIEPPPDYGFWRTYSPPGWTGPLLDFTFPNVRTHQPMTLPLFEPGGFDLFRYRQIIADGPEAVTVMNWPQDDYLVGHVFGTDAERHLAASRNLTLSVVHWLQTEHGFRGLRLRPDVSGTPDGLAMAPYHRESRRIRAVRTLVEHDLSPEAHPGRSVAPPIADSVGVGAYRIDLHPSSSGAPSIDVSALPYQIPLGSLVSPDAENLLPACKNIGTTHVTNGCTRLHPVEWNIGEVAGLLAAECLAQGATPQALLEPGRLATFQSRLQSEGIELAWPEIGPL
jgi:hypothetical protein